MNDRYRRLPLRLLFVSWCLWLMSGITMTTSTADVFETCISNKQIQSQMKWFTITCNVKLQLPHQIVSVAQRPSPASTTHACSPRPSGLSNLQFPLRCSPSNGGPSRIISRAQRNYCISRYTFLMSFNQPDYNWLHRLTTVLDINTSFSRQS